MNDLRFLWRWLYDRSGCRDWILVGNRLDFRLVLRLWRIEPGLLYWSKPTNPELPDVVTDCPTTLEECFEVAEASYPITLEMLQTAFARTLNPL